MERRSSKTFFVYEISAIRNISVNIPELIEIYHPKPLKRQALRVLEELESAQG